MGEKLGLGSAVSMALGGMIGGGIHAVLGIVVAVVVVSVELVYFRLPGLYTRVRESLTR